MTTAKNVLEFRAASGGGSRPGPKEARKRLAELVERISPESDDTMDFLVMPEMALRNTKYEAGFRKALNALYRATEEFESLVKSLPK